MATFFVLTGHQHERIAPKLSLSQPVFVPTTGRMAVTETWAMVTYCLSSRFSSSRLRFGLVALPSLRPSFGASAVHSVLKGQDSISWAIITREGWFRVTTRTSRLFCLYCFHHLFFIFSFSSCWRGIYLIGQRRRWVPRHQVRGLSFGVIPGRKGLTSWPKSVVSVHSRHEAWGFPPLS
ncbi:hypothetical protein LY78DRAFT_267023 [Colletotrichum sublineola]|nr:hypothetical protein LY78DRAFT_267023 [Colletotrichum sublineola]